MSERQAPQARPGAGVSAVDRVVEAIRQHLKTGDYAPGHHLVESDLTEEFQVSRGPVREALRRLVAEGLLTKEHNRGIRVRRMTREEVVSLYQAREVLEGLAARLAATHVGAAGFRARLRTLSAAMNRAIQHSDVDAYYRLNEDLHLLIVEMSGNSYVQTMVEQLRIPSMRLQFRQANQLERSRRSHEDHKPLIQAILKGDRQEAERAMRLHIRNSAEFVDTMAESHYAAGAAATRRVA